MNEYDEFEAEMLASGKSYDEIEHLWNTPPDPMSEAMADCWGRWAESIIEQIGE